MISFKKGDIVRLRKDCYKQPEWPHLTRERRKECARFVGVELPYQDICLFDSNRIHIGTHTDDYICIPAALVEPVEPVVPPVQIAVELAVADTVFEAGKRYKFDRKLCIAKCPGATNMAWPEKIDGQEVEFTSGTTIGFSGGCGVIPQWCHEAEPAKATRQATVAQIAADGVKWIGADKPVYLTEFVPGKRYVFEKAICRKRDVACKWQDECDGKEVTVETKRSGDIDIYIINPEWCREIALDQPAPLHAYTPAQIAEARDIVYRLITGLTCTEIVWAIPTPSNYFDENDRNNLNRPHTVAIRLVLGNDKTWHERARAVAFCSPADEWNDDIGRCSSLCKLLGEPLPTWLRREA